MRMNTQMLGCGSGKRTAGVVCLTVLCSLWFSLEGLQSWSINPKLFSAVATGHPFRALLPLKGTPQRPHMTPTDRPPPEPTVHFANASTVRTVRPHLRSVAMATHDLRSHIVGSADPGGQVRQRRGTWFPIGSGAPNPPTPQGRMSKDERDLAK